MEAFEFDRLMTHAEGCFSRKVSDQTRQVAWHAVKHIPGADVPKIMQRISGEEKSPANLTWLILRCWRDTGSIESRAEAHLGCPECDEGTIYHFRVKNGERVNSATNCAKCLPTAQYKATSAQLRANGWTVDTPAKGGNAPSPELVAKDMRKMLDSVSRTSEDNMQRARDEEAQGYYSPARRAAPEPERSPADECPV